MQIKKITIHKTLLRILIVLSSLFILTSVFTVYIIQLHDYSVGVLIESVLFIAMVNLAIVILLNKDFINFAVKYPDTTNSWVNVVSNKLLTLTFFSTVTNLLVVIYVFIHSYYFADVLPVCLSIQGLLNVLFLLYYIRKKRFYNSEMMEKPFAIPEPANAEDSENKEM